MTNKEAEAVLRALHEDLGKLLDDPERLEVKVERLSSWTTGTHLVWHLQNTRLPITEETYQRILRDAK